MHVVTGEVPDGQGRRSVQEDCEQRQAEEVPARLPVHADGGGGPGDGPVVQGQLRIGQEVIIHYVLLCSFYLSTFYSLCLFLL